MGFQARIVLLGVVLALLLSSRAANARTWRITPDGSGDAATIQAGIDSAQAGDEVVLAPGIYSRTTQGDNGNWLNRSMIELKAGVDLRSESGPEATILDAEREARVIWGQNIGSTRIEGLTLTRGSVGIQYGGGGIAIIGSSTPTIANCIIRECGVGPLHPGGGAFFQPPTAPVITDSKFLNNRVIDGQGGAISLRNGVLDRCLFRGNDANGDPGGSGGAISCRDTRINNCIFENNYVTGPFGVRGGAIDAKSRSQNPSYAIAVLNAMMALARRQSAL